MRNMIYTSLRTVERDSNRVNHEPQIKILQFISTYFTAGPSVDDPEHDESTPAETNLEFLVIFQH